MGEIISIIFEFSNLKEILTLTDDKENKTITKRYVKVGER